MAVQLFVGNVIAVIWDFDQTLIPGYQQDPLFAAYGIKPGEFWAEVNALTAHYREQGIVVSADTVYLNHILTYVDEGRMPDLTNERLLAFGAELTMYPGMPEFLDRSRASIEGDEEFRKHGIQVEHYVVSTGLRQTILGSPIGTQVKGVWACEFIEDPAPSGFRNPEAIPPPPSGRIQQVGYFLDNTTKTRALWEINKGTNVDPEIDVNASIAEEDRRVPLRNMIYVADGPSDIPVFSILNKYGGQTLGVYNPGSDTHFQNVKSLMDQGRIKMMAEANYDGEATAARWLLASLRQIAELIVRDRDEALFDRVVPPAGHVT